MQSSPRAWFRLLSSVTASSVVAFGNVRLACAQPAIPTPPSGPESAELTPDSGSERVIVLVRSPGDEGVMTRLRADLRENGWRILEVRDDERFAAAPLGGVAGREGASAAVRIDTRRDAIELWVQRPDGAVEETVASTEPLSDQVLALRAAEALRARGLLVFRDEAAPEAAALPPEAGRPAPPRPDVRSVPATSEPIVPASFWFEAGPGVTLSPGGLGPLPLVELGLRLEFLERWSVCLDGLVPLSHQALAGPEGEAEITTSVVGGLLELEWARTTIGGFRSGIGAAGTATVMSGKASAGFESADDTVTAFAPLARTSFHVGVGRAVRLRAAVMLGATLPPVRVAFGEREAATWGSPFVTTSVVVEVNPLPR
jgi:hypothetical protein